MGFFGSGDKLTTSNDLRAGASDSAILAQGAAAVFNGGGGKPAAVTNLWSVVAVVALAAFVLWLVLGKK